MRVCVLISVDDQMIDAIRALVERTAGWTLRVFDNVDTAWVSIIKNGICLSIFDLDFTESHARDYYERHEDLLQRGLMPAVIVTSSRPLTSPHGVRAARMHAMDFLQKPVDLDRIAFAMSVAGGPDHEHN